MEWLTWSWTGAFWLLVAGAATAFAVGAAVTRPVWRPERRDLLWVGWSLIWLGEALVPGKPGPTPIRVLKAVAATMVLIALGVTHLRHRRHTAGPEPEQA